MAVRFSTEVEGEDEASCAWWHVCVCLMTRTRGTFRQGRRAASAPVVKVSCELVREPLDRSLPSGFRLVLGRQERVRWVSRVLS